MKKTRITIRTLPTDVSHLQVVEVRHDKEVTRTVVTNNTNGKWQPCEGDRFNDDISTKALSWACAMLNKAKSSS